MGNPLSRRRFLAFGATALTGLGAAGAALSSSEYATRITPELLTLPLPRLPREFDGYRIGFLTDVHLSRCLPQEWLQDASQVLAKADIDLLLLGGDHVWMIESAIGRMAEQLTPQGFTEVPHAQLPRVLYSEVARIAAALKPRDGVFNVMGNHDWWIAPHTCLEVFARAGIRTLVNQQVAVRRGDAQLTVIGTDDYWNGVPEVPRLPARSTSASEFRILLTHNPDYVAFLAEPAGLDFDLALCGHTHGGQIKLPLLGALTYNVRAVRFGEGLEASASHLVYTSRGLGMVEIPVRLNCPPEVTVITLQAV